MAKNKAKRRKVSKEKTKHKKLQKTGPSFNFFRPNNREKKSSPPLIKENEPESIGSLQAFVQQVAETISKRHGNEDGSFIFGISGKWGEGKTHFLTLLREELIKDNFEIIDINPWKFSGDKISFLRYFLEKCGEKNKSELSKLEDDTTTNNISVKWLVILVVSIALLAYILHIYVVTPSYVKYIDPFWGWLITILLIPILLAIVEKITVTQTNNHPATNVDLFEKSLKKILESKKDKKKLVVYVDDLDRVTPQIAREVLDNLRTFFDIKELSFVVTGDHSIIEAYLGKELLPEGTIGEKLEEGKRYLKKIFNIYWRLTSPIDSEFKDFISKELLSKVEESKILNEAERKIFEIYLFTYFDKNYRHVKRFIDLVIFTFQTITIQKGLQKNDKVKEKYFDELNKFPLLVIRVLMIQEFCAPVFDIIVDDPTFLSTLEYSAIKGIHDDINRNLEKLSSENQLFTNEHKKFIQKFLYEEEKFYELSPSGLPKLRVSNIRPFLYIAADASFGDNHGLLPQDFSALFDQGNTAFIKDSIIDAGDDNLKSFSSSVYSNIQNTTTPNDKVQKLLTISNVLNEIPAISIARKIFLEKLAEIDFSALSGTPNTLVAFYSFWRILDQTEDEETLSKFNSKFDFISAAEFMNINISSAGKFTTKVVGQLFINYYNTVSKADGLIKLNTLLSTLDIKVLTEKVDTICESLVNDLLQNVNDAQNTLRSNLLLNYSTKGQHLLRSQLFNGIKNLREDLWNWSQSQISGTNSIWNGDELENLLVDKIDEINNADALYSILIFSRNKVKSKISDFWQRIADKQRTRILEILPRIVDDQGFVNFSPTIDVAKIIFDSIVQDIKDSKDISKTRLLMRNKWIWSSIDKLPSIDIMTELLKTEDQQFVEEVRRVLESWGETPQ